MTIFERYGTVLRCYDNGGKSFDRYTIIPPRWDKEHREGNLFKSIAASKYPYYLIGFGQHVLAAPGSHLGKRVHWDSLPADVQKFARSSFPEYV